jgi:hypothetical protein
MQPPGRVGNSMRRSRIHAPPKFRLCFVDVGTQALSVLNGEFGCILFTNGLNVFDRAGLHARVLVGNRGEVPYTLGLVLHGLDNTFHALLMVVLARILCAMCGPWVVLACLFGRFMSFAECHVELTILKQKKMAIRHRGCPSKQMTRSFGVLKCTAQ